MDMIMIGGGGGGGGAASTINAGAGGGGSGYIRTSQAVSIFGYNRYAWSVGSGGIGGTPGNQAMGGSNTTFTISQSVAEEAVLSPPITWITGGGGGGGGASAPVGSGGGPGGGGGAGGGGGWTRNTSGPAPGGAGQWNGYQQDNGANGSVSDQAIIAGAGGANQFGSLPFLYPSGAYGLGGFAQTGGMGGGYGGGYQTGVQSATCGVPIPGYGGGGGGQNSDGSGGQGDGSGGGNGAIGNVWIRWYFL